MASKPWSEAEGHLDEESVLETLASIKSQVFSVLQQLQQAKVSVTGATEMSSPSAPDSSAAKKAPSVPPNAEPPISRDDVKAQREAKKAEKAARKSKSMGKVEPSEGDSQSPSVPAKPSKNVKEQADNAATSPPKPSQKIKIQVATPTPTPSKKAQDKAVDPGTAGSPSPKEEPPVSLTPPPDGSGSSDPKKIETASPPQEVPLDSTATLEAEKEGLHPKFRELGLKYSNYVIRGSNQRTVALLKTIKSYVHEYKTPEGKGFKQDLAVQLQFSLAKLKLYRPFAVGMDSAIDGLNGAIRSLSDDAPDTVNKESIESWCDTFIEEKIEKAMEAIAWKGYEKIKDGDTILLFSLTDAIYNVFKFAGEMGKQFQIILAITNSDTYLHEYKQLQQRMGPEIFRKNVNVSCVNLSSVMSFISSVNMVFLGGHALFTTGGVMAHAGSSTIALCASHHNIPILFFCETYKFCDKSPTDAFYSDVFPENNFGFSSEDGDKTKESDQPQTATILYDVTPVNLVTCVITDIDMLPSSSVPVVLRVQETRPLTKCS